MKSDLTGKRFGKLIVEKPTDGRKHGCVLWSCRCGCGNQILLESRKLKEGIVTDCGCGCGEQDQQKQQKDLTGKRFGRLVVEGKTGRRSKNRSVLWSCRCDCGNAVETTRDKLLSGNTASCGCLRTQSLKDWTGRRFGNLEVIAYAGKKNGSHMWRCRCECGNETVVRQSNLQDGRTTSCGCKASPLNNMHFVEGTCVERIRSRKLSQANTSGIRGVSYNKRRGKWIAQIVFQGKVHYLGGYDRIEEAAKARARGEEMFEAFLARYEKEAERDEGKSENKKILS